MNWLAHIAGRGTAIAGEITEGTIRVGDRIVSPAAVPNVPLEIIGVEFADKVSTRESWIALMVAPPPDGPSTQALKDALSSGTVLEISSSTREARPPRDQPHNVR